MTTITAKTILRSRNASCPDKVLSTLLLTFPLWILAEMLTHRLFSRNGGSARAIPFWKLLRAILHSMAIPLVWGKNNPGMQSRSEMNKVMAFIAKTIWIAAGLSACFFAYLLHLCGAHKQIVNRILHPFGHIKFLVSATEWDNFLELRDHADAEPHMQILAKAIRAELERTDNIQDLEPGEWHLPFTDYAPGMQPDKLEMYQKLSVARCASTSYKTTDGFDMTLERAEKLYKKLFSKPFHSSPFEHCCQADNYWPSIDCWSNPKEHGNLTGFRQFRKQLEG